MAAVTAQEPSARGLSESEAQVRLKLEGYNDLPKAERRTPLRIVAEVLREPMLVLLLGGGGIYFLLGDLKEALILTAFASLSVVITVVQETRTERVLEALRDLTSPRALVIRDGVRKRIAGREVVRGDVIVLAEGDRVPADAVLIACHDLQADESLLTGESVPVRKAAGPGTTTGPQRPGGDDQPNVYSGSMIVRGSGTGEVTGTGGQSEIGKIGQSLSTVDSEPPRLQVETRRLVRLFAMVGGGVSVVVVLLYGLLRGGWLDAVLAGIALGMAMLPEEFPVVLTVFMAMGAWRISQARVLTRRAASIETLGSATVLCTDKTGTLTENRMSIGELRLLSGDYLRPREADGAILSEPFGELLRAGILASAREPTDPMEKAFYALGRTQAAANDYLPGTDWQLVRAFGLRPDLLAMSNVWRGADGDGAFMIAAKGAPEAIADLCRCSATERSALTHAIDVMADEGLRVLGVARARFAGKELPEQQTDFAFELLGLVGLADPLRASVHAAVNECRSAGIKVVMITGDYPATARAIARQAGIDAGVVVTGQELEQMSDTALAACVRSTMVFARILPAQKLRIVNALKANDEIVAMTGDGVNDAPSLKAAHIGIAMGGRGTDVAREASSMVLLDDDFGSIVKAIRLGRRIYDNLRKAMGFVFAVHVPIAVLALLPLLFGLPILFGPIHIAFLEMIIDPVCSLVFEAESEEENVMRRPPRSPRAALFSGKLIFWSLLQGTLASALATAILIVAPRQGMLEAQVRALVFLSLVLMTISLILVNRSFSASLATALRRPNRALVVVLFAVMAMLGATLWWPFALTLFHFEALPVNCLVLAAGAGALVLVSLEGLKITLRDWLRI